MPQHPPKDASRFAQAALALDAEFRHFERLADDLAHVNLASERGLERAQLLRGELQDVRSRIPPATHELNLAMEDARDRLAAAAAVIEAREGEVVERQQQTGELLGRYRRLAEMVQQITEAVGELRRAGGDSQPQATSPLSQHLPEISDKLGVLIGEAQALMGAARLLKMKSLEQNADSLRQSLQVARRRFSLMSAPAGGDASPRPNSNPDLEG